MRLYSDPESIDLGEPSLLAIVETILAIGLSIWLALYLGTVEWIANSACIAPLLLLRTSDSVRRGLKFFENRPDPLDADKAKTVASGGDAWGHALKCLVLYPMFPFALAGSALFSRLAGTLVSVSVDPMEALRQIPSNWKRIAMCVDTCRAPELVPGIDIEDESIGLSAWMTGHYRPPSSATRLEVSFARFFWLPIIVVCGFAPAWIYRWSLKATSLIYLPLIWIAWTATRRFESVSRELTKLYKGEMAQLTLVVSGVVIFAFTLKFFAMVAFLEMEDWWTNTDVATFWATWTADTEMGKLADRLVVPDRIPAWHVASFANAILAFSLAAFARRLLSKEYKDKWNVRGSTVYRVLRVSGVIRVFLSCYTIGCSLWITLSTVESFKLPKIGEVLPIS